MPAKKRSRGATEVGLSKQRLVSEAIRLADQEGVEGLSMRRLATALGAGAMSLYHYVGGKEELLDAMIDVVFGEIELPTEGVEWQAAMRHRALSARQVLGRHPWAIALMDSRITPGPAHLRHREAITGTLRKGGFSVLLATHAAWLLDSYVYGFALQEASVPFGSADELKGMVEDAYLPQIPADTFPYLHESAAELAAVNYDPREEFEFGLDLILAGLEQARVIVVAAR